MGLTVTNISLQSGIDISNSYSRIESLGGSKDSIFFVLSYYVTQAARADGKPFFFQKQFNFVPSVEDDAPNFIKQGYEYLKTLPEFSSAVDA